MQDGKDLRVRFLQNPEEWYSFREHYSQATKFFPCTGDRDSCPGCVSEDEKLQRSSKRYVASVLDVAQAKVIPLKMPIDLANRVINKCDRNHGTLLDRDFTLIRTGKGMNDTTYDVEAEDKSAVDLARYEVIDIEPILAASFQETFGDNPVSPPTPAPAQRPSIAELNEQMRAQRGPTQEEAGSPFEQAPKDVPGATPMEQKKNLEESGVSVKTESSSPTQTTPQVPSTSDSPTSAESFLSMNDLKSMNEDDLRQLCADNDLKPPAEATDRQDVLDWLLAEFGV